MELGVEDLPAPQATLAEVIRFASAHDPTLTFQARWGTDYRSLAMELWQCLLEAYQDKRPAVEEFSREEMLMGLNYDIAAGAHVQARDPSQSFHQWLIQGLRQSFS